jgi:hypothetical protein
MDVFLTAFAPSPGDPSNLLRVSDEPQPNGTLVNVKIARR